MDYVKRLTAAGFQPQMIFDIGANIGSTVKIFRRAFPTARVHAFEPVSATFEMLEKNVGADSQVELHRMAMSKAPGEALMRAVPGGLMNKFIRQASPKVASEIVRVETGDRFCAERGIAGIDFLKVDAEGADLDVLQGFENMLAEKKIRFLQVECGVSPDNSGHINLVAFIDYMGKKNYGFAGTFDCVYNNPIRKQVQGGIYYCNAVFAAD